jgi:hypothetical protein
MSSFGTKQTKALPAFRLAIGGKADWVRGALMSPFDPLPPSAIQSSCVAVFLFDQLVRAQQDRCRHIEAKRLGGLHIEHGLVFRSNFARSSAAISLAKA